MQLSIVALRDTCFSRRASSALGLRGDGGMLKTLTLSLIHISEPTRLSLVSRMPSSA